MPARSTWIIRVVWAYMSRAIFWGPRMTILNDPHLERLLDRLIEGPVDFMLVDIWISMARPALELVAPHLRPRAVVTCDNTGREDERVAYGDYFTFINDPAQGFRTMTLPFSSGLEMSVRLD